MAGKWHLGDAPQFSPMRQGFDEYYGLPYSNDMWPLHPDYVNLPPDSEKHKRGYPPLPLLENESVVKLGLTGEDQARLTIDYTERAVRFIQKHRDRPFFFYLAHSMPHVPLYVSPGFAGKTARGLYGDVIAEIDWSVGRILETLKACGLEQNTLVIFTSDNGPWLSYGDHSGSAGPLREGKGTVWEGGVRVPAIARWPARIPAGRTCAEPVMTIDLLPTLARLTGADLPARKIDGLDISPLLFGEPGVRAPHEALYFYYHENELQAVMSGPWKLMLPQSYRTLGGKPGGTGGNPAPYEMRKLEQPELYNVEADIAETRDLATAQPQTVRRLLDLAEEARSELGDRLTGRKGGELREPGRIDQSR
jgi:arylsulfatase